MSTPYDRNGETSEPVVSANPISMTSSCNRRLLKQRRLQVEKFQQSSFRTLFNLGHQITPSCSFHEDTRLTMGKHRNRIS